MDSVREYIACVTGAAIICGIVKGLVGKQGSIASLINLLCGLFLAVTAVNPLIKIQIQDISDYIAQFQLEAEQTAAAGENQADSEMAAIIKSRTEAYILDKADALQIDITVSVALSDSDPPVPCSAVITGAVSPYAKAKLSRILEEDLGIYGEAQQWNT